MKGIAVCCDGEKTLKQELVQMKAGKNNEENALKILQLLWNQSLSKKNLKKKGR